MYLYLDDGESLEPNATKLISFAAQIAQGGNVTLHVSADGEYDGLDTALGNVTVLGVSQNYTTATVNGEEVGQVSFNETSGIVLVAGLDEVMGGAAWGTAWNITIS